MDQKELKANTHLVVRGNESLGLTARGRTMKVEETQVVTFKPPNKYYDLRLRHIGGPLKGVLIHFRVAHARKAETRAICTCPTYSWPHIKGSGKCLIKTDKKS